MTGITRRRRLGRHDRARMGGSAYRGRRRSSGAGPGATTPSVGKTGTGGAGSLDRLEHLTHLARQVLDLLQTGERFLVELLGREKQDLRFREDRRQGIGQIVPELEKRGARIRHQSSERYRSRRW